MAVKLRSPKQTEKQWAAYVKALEKGGPVSPKMEALRPFMGARGGILKRETRSNKQKEAFNAAVAGVQQTHGKHATPAHFTSKSEKARATRAKNAVKQHQKQQKKKQTGKPLTKTAKKIAEDAAKKYDEMLAILTEGSQKLLSAKVRYEIYRAMDEQNVSSEDIAAFIRKLLATLKDIPEEASDLAKGDDYISALMALSEAGDTEQEDFTAMFTAITSVSRDDHENVMNAVRYWEDPENNPSGMSFAQFWAELESYNDLGSEDNYREILGSEED